MMSFYLILGMKFVTGMRGVTSPLGRREHFRQDLVSLGHGETSYLKE